MQHVREEIEAELSWLVTGGATGAELEFAAREAARAVLTRHRIKPVRITASSRGGQLEVQVDLPKTDPRIEVIRVRVR